MRNKIILIMLSFLMSVTTLMAEDNQNIALDKSEIQFLELINNFRSASKTDALILSKTLSALANSQVEQMKKGNGELNHYFPSISVKDVSNKEVSFSVSEGNVLSVKDGEGNIIYTQSIFMGSVKNIGAFLRFSYHRDNVLNNKFKYVGIKRVNDVYVLVLSEVNNFNK